MPSTLTGVAASATQSTAPTASAPADGDSLAAAGVQGPIQTILNHIAKLWAGAFAALGTNPALQATGSATRAGLNLVPQAAPSAPSDGDVWIETTTNVAKARVNGATTTLAAQSYVDARGVKAWAMLQCSNAGAVQVTKSFNVASAVYSGSILTVTLASALADVNAAIVVAPFGMGFLVSSSGMTSTTSTGINKASAVSTAANWVPGDNVSIAIYD